MNTTTLERISKPAATPAVDVLERVSALAKGFRERVAVTEEQREVPAESIAELIEAGVARMMVPREHGGLDMRFRDLCEVTAASAYGCPSTGWLTCLMAGVPHTLALFSPEAQRAIWADGPDVIGAGSLGVKATRVPGGFRISGQSPFSSGVKNATWVYLVGAIPADSGPPEIRFFLIPISECSVVDTWQTVAMRGTGSNTIVTDDVFVPEAFTLGYAEVRDGATAGSAANANPIFTLPWSAYSALGFASTLLGAAEGAYDEVVRVLKHKRNPGGDLVANSEVLQVGVGTAQAQIRTARMLILACADRADASPHYDSFERATAMRDVAFAAKLLKQAIDGLVEISGTSGFATSNMLQQFWRDANFAAAHQGLNARVLAGYYGRLALEIENLQRPMFY